MTSAEKRNVSSKDNQAEAVINVVDSGEGIHHEIIPRLFRKFASRSNSGTGLGLNIFKSIERLLEVEYGPKVILMRSELRLVSVYLLVKISNKLRTLRTPSI